jgi:hypothetical protein
MKNKNKKKGFSDDVEVPFLILDYLQPIGTEEQLYAIDPLEETRQEFINRVWCDYYNHPPYVNTGLAKYDGKDFSFFSKGENVTDEEFAIADENCKAEWKKQQDRNKDLGLRLEEDVFYPLDPLPYDDLGLGDGRLGLGSGGPGPQLGLEEVHPIDMLRKDILRSSVLPKNSDMAPEEALMIDEVTQPIAPIPQTIDETMTPVGSQPLAASTYTLENISNELNVQSPIAQAAAEKLATMQQSAPMEETKKAEIKVSKNLNPYVIALGVVVGLLIIDKLMMKDATGN